MTYDDSGARRAAGLAIIAEMFGAGVATRRMAAGDASHARLNALLTDTAYGTVWNNDTLTRRERSLITVALLAAADRGDELRSHLRAARTNGCTIEELYEAMVQVFLYSGFPAALGGYRAIDDITND